MDYKIVKVEYSNLMPMDRKGDHSTGRIIIVENLQDSYCFPKGSINDFYEYENDWTVKYSDEELIGMEY